MRFYAKVRVVMEVEVDVALLAGSQESAQAKLDRYIDEGGLHITSWRGNPKHRLQRASDMHGDEAGWTEVRQDVTVLGFRNKFGNPLLFRPLRDGGGS